MSIGSGLLSGKRILSKDGYGFDYKNDKVPIHN
jgi:hypothetical protein